jgi:N-formylglutamate amidohydrolase
MLIAPWSRYVVDLNRPPDDKPLYDQATSALLTGLVPARTFSGEEVYSEDRPGEEETSKRLADYWMPYHNCLEEELSRIREQHGFAILLDAHSIRSHQPLLFKGTLPDLNIGSNSRSSADPSLIDAATRSLSQPRYSLVVDGRFKGGYITRHYGRPDKGVHALQLEMAQSAYMREEPPEWEAKKASGMMGLLEELVTTLINWRPSHG